MKKRANAEVDADVLIEMVNSGKVTIEALINLGSFAAGKLKDVSSCNSLTFTTCYLYHFSLLPS